MGEGKKDALKVNFNKRLKLEFHGVKVTSDAGLLAYREINDVFELTDMAACELRDNRTGKNMQHSVTALLRQSVYSRLAGYEDTNDAQWLPVDPAIRLIGNPILHEKTSSNIEQLEFLRQICYSIENAAQSRCVGIAEQGYTMLYGKSEIKLSVR